MSGANPLWGAPRVHGELLKPGIDVGQNSVAKYMVRRRVPPSRGWRTFLRNHADGIAAMDPFVVPIISFRLLYGLLIMGHGRRQLLWFELRHIQRPNGSPISSLRLAVINSDKVFGTHKGPHQALVQRLERDDVLSVGQHHPSDRDLVHLSDGFADDGKCVVADLAVGTEIIGSDQISRIDLAAVNELVDLYCARRFQGHVLEFILRHLDEGVRIDLVAFNDVLVGDFLAGIGIHLGVLDAVAGFPIELVERDLFG
jgi:hypothetical protein